MPKINPKAINIIRQQTRQTHGRKSLMNMDLDRLAQDLSNRATSNNFGDSKADIYGEQLHLAEEGRKATKQFESDSDDSDEEEEDVSDTEGNANLHGLENDDSTRIRSNFHML